MKNLPFALSICIITILSIAIVFVAGLLYNSIIKAKSHVSSTLITVEPLMVEANDTVYGFTLPALDGSLIKLSDFKGNVLLIVNTAAQCGLANQYKELEELYQTYKDKGFVVLGVSSNDFDQEIADHKERACSISDRVVTTFPTADTVHVTESKKDGYEAVPLYTWLNQSAKKSKSMFSATLGPVKWNFHKFLIGKDGHFIDWFAATTKPTAKKIRKAIEAALAA